MNTREESFATRLAPTRLFFKREPPMFLLRSLRVSQPNSSANDLLRGNGVFQKSSRTSLMTNWSALIEFA